MKAKWKGTEETLMWFLRVNDKNNNDNQTKSIANKQTGVVYFCRLSCRIAVLLREWPTKSWRELPWPLNSQRERAQIDAHFWSGPRLVYSLSLSSLLIPTSAAQRPLFHIKWSQLIWLPSYCCCLLNWPFYLTATFTIVVVVVFVSAAVLGNNNWG